MSRMRLIHALATCNTCGKTWGSRNAQAVGARHHQATGHEVYVEVGLAVRYGGAGIEPRAEADLT